MIEPAGWKELVAKMRTGAPPYKPAPTPPMIAQERVIRKLPTCSDPAKFVTRRLTMLDHALQWAGKGLHIFPVEMFLGLPVINNWSKAATTDTDTIAQSWATDPTYDIAAVPHKSGHYVIVCTGEIGRESLAQFEMERGVLTPAFRYRTHWDAEHLWFKGDAHSGRIDDGLYLVGNGQYVYLAPSAAPDPTSWSR
jgi:hypothetical protein